MIFGRATKAVDYTGDEVRYKYRSKKYNFR